MDNAGGAHLLHPTLHRITSSIGGSSEGDVKTIWSGLACVNKALHVLLLVLDTETQSHHLRVVRLAICKEDDQNASHQFVEPTKAAEQQNAKRFELQHVCAHLLVVPDCVVSETTKGRAAQVSSACFDESSLRLSVLWKQGWLVHYDFHSLRQLASVSPPPPSMASPTSRLHIDRKLVKKGVVMTQWRQDSLVLGWNTVGESASGTHTTVLCAINTVFGVVCATPLQWEVEDDNGDAKACALRQVVPSSNEQFLLVARCDAVFRCTLATPFSALQRDVLGTCALTRRLFGMQPSPWWPEGKVAHWCVEFDKNHPDKGGVVSQSQDQMEEEKFLALAKTKKKQKMWTESFVTPRLVPGKGHREGIQHVSSMAGRDRYTMSVEFAHESLWHALGASDWDSAERLLEARMCDLPPAGFVSKCIELGQTRCLLSVVKCSLALVHDDVAAILAYAVEKDLPALFEATILCQDCSGDVLMRTALKKVDVAIVKTMFSQLHALFKKGPIHYDAHQIIEWLSCCLDAHPLAFELDAKMQRELGAVCQDVDAALKRAKKYTNLAMILEVMRYNTLDVPVEVPQDYGIEVVILK